MNFILAFDKVINTREYRLNDFYMACVNDIYESYHSGDSKDQWISILHNYKSKLTDHAFESLVDFAFTIER